MPPRPARGLSSERNPGGLRLLSDTAPADVVDELGWAVRRHPAGRDLHARLAAAEAECAQLATRRGRARARTADAITAAGAAVHTAARALADRIAP